MDAGDEEGSYCIRFSLDDEVLGYSGVIAKKLDEGYGVSVISMTDGRML